MKILYKRFILIAIVMMAYCQFANSQEKKHEISAGASWGGSSSNIDATGLSAKVDLNLDYYFTKKWSLMTGIRYWVDGVVMDDDSDGGDDDGAAFVSDQ